MSPPSAGPAIRAMLSFDAFSEFATMRRSRPTRVGNREFSAGATTSPARELAMTDR